MSEGGFLDAFEQEDIDGRAAKWTPIIYRRAAIEAEVERLSGLEVSDPRQRASWLVHPQSTSPGKGLTPGIRVSLAVLLPGETTTTVRHNSTLVNFCISGSGVATVGGKGIRFGSYDVWNTPSYVPYSFTNDSEHPQVRITYSNAALLEKLGVHLEEAEVDGEALTKPAKPLPEAVEGSGSGTPFGILTMPAGDAMLMPYEILINPPIVRSEALHWPWSQVKEQLDRLESLGADYVGRRLYLLYNPVTGRANGTTPSFFATMTLRPPGIVDRPHRHVSAAINYFFSGSGWSRVGGKRYEWGAGDLMFTAPGWTIHNHASNDEPVYELTIQDQPLHIAMESLLWQEDLRLPARVLGVDQGFATNRTSPQEGTG